MFDFGTLNGGVLLRNIGPNSHYNLRLPDDDDNVYYSAIHSRNEFAYYPTRLPDQSFEEF